MESQSNEIKKKSIVELTVSQLVDMAATIEKLEGIVPESVYFSISLPTSINIWPNTPDEARRIVGGLIMRLKTKPAISKWGSTDLEAKFEFSGIQLSVNRYRGKKCAIVKKQIIHEAKPEEIVPAKEAWVEEVEELVCELPSVEAELKEQIPKEEVAF